MQALLNHQYINNIWATFVQYMSNIWTLNNIWSLYAQYIGNIRNISIIYQQYIIRYLRGHSLKRIFRLVWFDIIYKDTVWYFSKINKKSAFVVQTCHFTLYSTVIIAITNKTDRNCKVMCQIWETIGFLKPTKWLTWYRRFHKFVHSIRLVASAYSPTQGRGQQLTAFLMDLQEWYYIKRKSCFLL